MTQLPPAEGKTGTTAFATLQKSVEALLPLIDAESEEAERQFRLSDKVVSGLRKAGLNSMLLPSTLGGRELPFIEALQLVERIAWADAATGWCAMLWGEAACSTGVSLPDEGIAALYGKGPDIMIAGGGQPRGTARAVPGGYMIKGIWSYGSGISHADWIMSGCMLLEDGRPKLNPDGTPNALLMYHPRSTIELKGNWDVIGLRGSGSYDYTLKDEELFVPDYLCYPLENARIHRGGIQYRIGFPGYIIWAHCGWALGVGRRALDEIRRAANERQDVFGLLADSITFRKEFAEAEAKFRSVRAFVYEGWGALTESFARGDEGSIEQRTLIRLAMHHLHDVVSQIATFAHRASRGLSLRASKLQRVYRDVHAGTQHICVSGEIVPEIGRVLLGRIGPGSSWSIYKVKG